MAITDAFILANAAILSMNLDKINFDGFYDIRNTSNFVANQFCHFQGIQNTNQSSAQPGKRKVTMS